MSQMNSSIQIRAFGAHEWYTYRTLRLQSLAESPDAFGSTLALERSQPEAHWMQRLCAGVDSPHQLPLVAEIHGESIGLAWCVYEPPTCRALLFQMWVSPKWRGMGAGHALLSAFKVWAEERGANNLELSVSCGNAHANKLYVSFGFVPYGEPLRLRPGSRELMQPMRLTL